MPGLWARAWAAIRHCAWGLAIGARYLWDGGEGWTEEEDRAGDRK